MGRQTETDFFLSDFAFRSEHMHYAYKHGNEEE